MSAKNIPDKPWNVRTMYEFGLLEMSDTRWVNSGKLDIKCGIYFIVYAYI